ncbi:hypothetical protein KCU75_g16, partial [Aureobasidium melanogenum]
LVELGAALCGSRVECEQLNAHEPLESVLLIMSSTPQTPDEASSRGGNSIVDLGEVDLGRALVRFSDGVV